jgi:uncharacterized YigZ family protein
MDDIYQTIAKESTGIFKDKGSKFLAFAYPVSSEAEVKEILLRLRKEHHSARHHCYAWRIGTETIQFRSNDDGEPSSTAGKPILGQLLSYNVTNTVIVVVRYFGGILLGASGLINAYRNAAADVLANAIIVQKTIEKNCQLHFSYNEMSDVMNLIKQEDLTVVSTRFEEKCELTFSVRKNDLLRVTESFSKIYGVKISAAV